MYKTILAIVISVTLVLYPASAGAPATGGDTANQTDISVEVIVDSFDAKSEPNINQIPLVQQARGELVQNNSDTELDLIMPLAGPSVHTNYSGPADAFHWKDINSGKYHIYGVANGKFIYQPGDTWFVYGLFGPIEAIKYDWNIKYPLWNGKHNGIDFAVASGTPVIAASGGEVIFAGLSAGNTIVIKQNNFHITYSHLQSISVSVGEFIAQSQIIGRTGSSGTVNPHLHFQIDEYRTDLTEAGKRWAINPIKYLPSELQTAIMPNVPANKYISSLPNLAEDFRW